ncbi:hypothetical protein B0H14DRAFT_3898587 [Mycena olivaceomarginata]|nr:hypothetical protein B0H14DRAFT_3898587 [Mycena olivaceomarginata]
MCAHDSVKLPLTAKTRVATFESPCGRLGCNHVFKYEGIDPLKEISALVKAHSIECRGGNYTATHADAEWQAPNNLKCFCKMLEDDSNGVATTAPKPPPFRPKLPPTPPTGPKSKRKAAEALTKALQRQSEAVSTTLTTSERRGSAVEQSANIAKPAKLPFHRSSIQKTPDHRILHYNDPRDGNCAKTPLSVARTLNLDEYTLGVTSQHVVCRGCRKTVPLHRRNEYNPGVWRKHRSRCEGVKKRRGLEVREPRAAPIRAFLPRTCAVTAAPPTAPAPDCRLSPGSRAPDARSIDRRALALRPPFSSSRSSSPAAAADSLQARNAYVLSLYPRSLPVPASSCGLDVRCPALQVSCSPLHIDIPSHPPLPSSVPSLDGLPPLHHPHPFPAIHNRSLPNLPTPLAPAIIKPFSGSLNPCPC